GLGAAGAVIEAVALVVVASGVLATVESPEPQALSVAAINTTTGAPISGPALQGSDHTSRNRTVIQAAAAAGAAACRAQLRWARDHHWVQPWRGRQGPTGFSPQCPESWRGRVRL